MCTEWTPSCDGTTTVETQSPDSTHDRKCTSCASEFHRNDAVSGVCQGCLTEYWGDATGML